MIEERPNVARFRAAVYAYLAYTVFVIVWGAYVRVSFSGDGCGDHWPLCRGVVIPQGGTRELAVEFFHRVTSALCGIFAIGFVITSRRLFPDGHAARRWSVIGLVLVVSEGLFGAVLVKLRLVAHDTSVARAYLMAAHLCNTFALVYAIVVVADRARERGAGRPLTRRELAEVVAAYVGLLLVGMTGAVTALGDTLFPSQGFRAGLIADFHADSHPFLQLRAFHPLFALATAGFLLYFASARLASAPRELAKPLYALCGLLLCQVVVGFANIAFGAPAFMQLVHLFLADGVFVAFTFATLRLGADAG